MHTAQSPYRELKEQLNDCAEGELGLTVSKWLTAHTSERAWIEKLARANENSIPRITIEDLWRLYALSRASDALITLIGNDTNRVKLYREFMNGLGLCEISAERFHPFYHELVDVTPSGNAEDPIQITEVVWPGFMCGSLMIARTGVSVKGGVQHIRKEIAETSTLYWTSARAKRPTEDRSLGWGTNSQWRTTFRRDYAVSGQFHYNSDGNDDPGDPVLAKREQLELLRHRCFVTTERDHRGLYPYELRHSEPMP